MLVVFVCFARLLSGYSVLTHEAIIDAAWDTGIQPLLLARYPGVTAAGLHDARAYAYGGCIIQDMGYYPFGSQLFSDLTHYVRSGDFIVALLAEAQDVNEYAFALGALSHYASDIEGHKLAVDLSVPIDYPKLGRKFGPVMTYEDNRHAHVSVEFGFDVLQVARGSYAPRHYHEFIGFKVARPSLDRAFRDTYGIRMTDIFPDLGRALRWYRRTVSVIIPEMTRVAWSQKGPRLEQAGLLRRDFVYHLSRAEYNRAWEADYHQPGIRAHALGIFMELFPRVGVFKTFSFKIPPGRTEVLFERSFQQALDLYNQLLARQGSGQLQLADVNLDTAQVTRPGDYRLADNAYASLAILLAQKDPASLSPALRQNVLAFFADLKGPFATRRTAGAWRQTVAAVEWLRAQGTASRVQQ